MLEDNQSREIPEGALEVQTLKERIINVLLRVLVGTPQRYDYDDPNGWGKGGPLFEYLIRHDTTKLPILRPQEKFISPSRWLFNSVLMTGRELELIFELHGIIKQEPSLEKIQEHFRESLLNLVRKPEKFTNIYSEQDMELVKGELAGILSYTGMALSHEIRAVLNGGDYENHKSPHDKYLTYKEIIEYTNGGGIIGLLHGSFDKPHIGHFELIRDIFPYCDKLVIGISNDTFLQASKGSNTDPRPRYPLAWRLWEMACHPMVDAVFVIPFTSTERIDESFFNLYQELNVRRLGSGSNNPYLDKYTNRMRQLRGRVITHAEEYINSTIMHHHFSRYPDFDMNALYDYASKKAEEALACGYLHDQE